MNWTKYAISGAFTLLTLISPTAAQEYEGCYMLEDGQMQSLAHLCPVEEVPVIEVGTSSLAPVESDKTCTDFTFQESAQIYMAQKGATELDGDSDGVACEILRKLPREGAVGRSQKEAIDEIEKAQGGIETWQLIETMQFRPNGAISPEFSGLWTWRQGRNTIQAKLSNGKVDWVRSELLL